MTVPSYKRPQILALAPDPASAKAGEGLARRAKWLHYATDGRALWGECQGSGSTPYRTQVDLAGPAFRCSCPSRKFPCKHGLGLMLLHADVPAASAETPDWVGEWLAKRESRAATAPAAPATPAEAAPAPAAKATADPEAAAKRAEKRLARVSAGVEALGLWLADAVRTGLDGAPQQPPGHWREADASLLPARGRHGGQR
ncbi:SWIM zinc finger family protein [Plasticicumulans sp.]|uniref:SWIM zinc finger family protein n=1 Tax=Plasticicumulans sp. TaxID=2307179 RepID=UPI002BFE28AD|nr:SWIM zinc finger family protein [Plasticicumulans sp.]HNM44534.1 SWIM zinc finger family protein [Plasticicumulans sp.]